MKHHAKLVRELDLGTEPFALVPEETADGERIAQVRAQRAADQAASDRRQTELSRVIEAVDRAFAPDIEFGLAPDGHIASRRVHTSTGCKALRAIRGQTDPDAAMRACSAAGIEATFETYHL